MKPTDLADQKLFNTGSDNTIPAKNKYYKTKDNLPFAISFVENFDYPTEKTNIKDAYLKYNDWVNSGGLKYADWYSNKASGYRENEKIFKK
jgi:LruC domain-containing protein